jgi:hypothetical protein
VATIKEPRPGSIRITDEQLRLYGWAMSIRDCDGDLEWEEDGGRRREFLNISGALHQLLGLQLWDTPVTSDLVERDPASWPVRQALEEAAEAEERQGKPVVRPNGNGLSESEEIRKRVDAALPRARWRHV